MTDAEKAAFYRKPEIRELFLVASTDDATREALGELIAEAQERKANG